jgi:hypothetical protein
MASGKSAAKREARKAAAAEAWSYLEGASTTGALNKAEGLEGGADRYNAAVEKYNTRLAQVQSQMKGQDYTEGIKAETAKYTTKLASQLEASDKNKNPFNLSPSTNIMDQIRGPQKKDYNAEATRILTGHSGYTGDIARVADHILIKNEFQTSVAKYRGFTSSYRDLSSSSAVAKDLETYAAAVNEARKADKIDEQVKYQSSSAYQNLLAARKSAKANQNRQGTILAGQTASTTAVAETATKKRTVLGKA